MELGDEGTDDMVLVQESDLLGLLKPIQTFFKYWRSSSQGEFWNNF